jgi:hypothetical protein
MTRESKLTEHSRLNMEEKRGNVMFVLVNCNWVTNLTISEVKNTGKTQYEAIKRLSMRF